MDPSRVCTLNIWLDTYRLMKCYYLCNVNDVIDAMFSASFLCFVSYRIVRFYEEVKFFTLQLFSDMLRDAKGTTWIGAFVWLLDHFRSYTSVGVRRHGQLAGAALLQGPPCNRAPMFFSCRCDCHSCYSVRDPYERSYQVVGVFTPRYRGLAVDGEVAHEPRGQRSRVPRPVDD